MSIARRQFLAAGLFYPVLVNSRGSAKSPATTEPAYAKELTTLADAHKGTVTIGVKHLKTGESWYRNADTPLPTASLCKFPVMIEAYNQAESKQISLDQMLTLKKEDKVPGSGILTNDFSPGSTLALRDAIRLMIKFSDNTATNLVLDVIGLESTAKTMESLGYPNTKIHSKVYKRETSVFPERSKEFGLGSTTSGEMVRLYEALNAGKLVSPAASKEMYAHLLTCDDHLKFRRYLPYGTKVAFKTGSVDATRTAAGIIETKSGPVALSVLTDKNEDQSWTPENAGDLLCSKVAKIIFEHYNRAAEK